MKKFTAILAAALIFRAASAQPTEDFFLFASKFYNDSVYYPPLPNRLKFVVNGQFADFHLDDVLKQQRPLRQVLAKSKKGLPVDLYFFPGKTTKRALVIGGMHGSELSSIEVAKQLVRQLSAGEKPEYAVIIIPSLFPDNAKAAMMDGYNRIEKNTGRYSHPEAVDPNRQMPALAKAFFTDDPVDLNGRTIEKENQLLLQLIQAYGPERIVNIHAIKNKSKAGIFADPRTDCNGIAEGFDADSTLAVNMAKYIVMNGGMATGNSIHTQPTALYYLDPAVAAAGQVQQRNFQGSNVAKRGHGVSLGGWCTTAVCDNESGYQRPAITLLTMEFPGYERPLEYKKATDRNYYASMVDLYAASIKNCFLNTE